MTIKVFSIDLLDEISRQAAHSPRRRKHWNIHSDHSEPCQRLFNAIEPDSYLRPHRHGPEQGPETMIAIRGRMSLVVFDDDGKISEVHAFGAGRHLSDYSCSVGAETPPGRWHSVVSMESGSILLEIKAGPFDPSAAKFLAPWAPEEGSPESSKYLAELVEALRR